MRYGHDCMLMEDRVEEVNGTENVEKPMSLEAQRIYNQRPWVAAVKKHGTGNERGGGNVLKRKLDAGDHNEGRKICKKEVLLSSFSSGGKKNKKSAGDVGKSAKDSVNVKPESQEGSRVDGYGVGFGGIVLSLSGGVNVPRRPRGLVRRKKVEVGFAVKQEGGSNSKVSLAEGGGEVNLDGGLLQNGVANGKSAQNGEYEGGTNSSVIEKVKRKKSSRDCKGDRTSSPDLLQNMKRDDGQSSLGNGNSVTKKARRNQKKNDSGVRSSGLTVEAKPSLDEASRIGDDSLDDEENLEANAARMLSSRFDPSCTGFSIGGKSSKLPSSNGPSGLISSSRDFSTTYPNSGDELDITSSDAEAGVLQPKEQQKENCSRKRRHFYEVLFKDLESHWVLNRRIKVFWPLDQSWYFGHVTAFDQEKNLHHVKYDDRDEEWIDLQNERFKLLLLPSEVPGKGGRKRLTANSRKVKPGDTADTKENSNSSYMESEPIISWLARSNHHKLPPSGIRKKKRTSLGSAKSQSSSISEGKIVPQESLEVGCSGRDADDIVLRSALPGGSLREGKLIADLSNDDKTPIVYFRKRLNRKEQPSSSFLEGSLCQLPEKPQVYDFSAEMSLSIGECVYPANILGDEELIWDTDCFGFLKLIPPVTSLKDFSCDLSFPLPVLINNIVGWQCSMFLLQHGTLISTSPMVSLEILFVDNAVGLWFLLFEGCMKQAVSFVFLVLSIFCQSEQKERRDDQQLPVTSVRFRFFDLQYIEKQLVFTFYNFSEIGNSKWLFLDRKLKEQCILTKQLPLSECTFDNIKLLNGSNQWKLTNISREPSSVMNLKKRSQQRGTSYPSRQSACVKLGRLAFDSDEKHGKLPPFSLPLAAAPSFFLSLHLRLLMEHSIPSSSFTEQDPIYLMDHPDVEVKLVGADRCPVDDNFRLSSPSVGGDSLILPNGSSELDSFPKVDLRVNDLSVDLAEEMTVKPSYTSQKSLENEADSMRQLENGKAQLIEIEKSLLSARPFDTDNHLCSSDNKLKGGCLNGVTVDIQTSVPVEMNIDADVQNIQNSVISALDTNDGICSPNSFASQSMWDKSRISHSCSSASTSLSPGCIDGKQDFLRCGFGNGPKKPRTQVSYSLPSGVQDCNKNKFQQSKGFSNKRIRRASEKKIAEAFGTTQKNMDLLSCEANLLVCVGDRGWREYGARIVLELYDHNEWRLCVKNSGDTRYSYKAHQFVQPGTTNRFTHAMMWKGGKDWTLEFPDRYQWTIFREMHGECFNRNFRAASVKNIPIPGVRLVEENDDNVLEVPYVRPSPKYYRQVATDIDIALDPSHVLYDMDSDDERWLVQQRGLEFNENGCGDVSDEMFEKTIDLLEKFAYAKQCDHFSLDELEEATADVGPFKAIKFIYEHWREKRQRKGIPLVRHLQPPLWEKYQQQVKEWEQVMAKSNLALATGGQEKPLTTEKPPMFAFCLKPRGLELPNRGSKQRSQKRLPVNALSNGIPGDSDAYHSLVGRRLNGFSLGDDRAVYAAYNQGTSDTSPVLQGSTRVFSPRDSGALRYFSLSSDGYERNHYPKLYRNKSKKLCFIPSSNDQQPFASYSPRTLGKRNAFPLWGSSEWPSQMHYQLDGSQRRRYEQLDPSELDEFRLRDATSAARHAVTVAKMKRENAQRMLCRADIAMHKAVAAIMTAEAVKVSCGEQISDTQMTG